MWELSYTFSTLCLLICPVQFAVAVVATVTGPYCYYSFSGAVGTGYLGYVVMFPYPYLRFRDLCLDPVRMEWYHLGLQIADLLCGAVIFVLSLAIVIALTRRLLRQGHLNEELCVP
ncbi:transmembrane protein 212-like [Megalops cyprinoides]|uniref:transmembrane protein 212-like n=1 Tax=Megalops cyprinoides TaxID=118141 RepID=UPI001864898A|nr:transmembrane protein 212-like [Megalops cyprinoides]